MVRARFSFEELANMTQSIQGMANYLMGTESGPEGMTEDEVREILERKKLRDQFAMAALPVAVKHGGTFLDTAEYAYCYADAMLKARDA
jgi:hypothetical protein